MGRMCSSSSEMVWLFELTRPLAGGLVIVGVIGQTCYYLDHGVTVPGNEQLSFDNLTRRLTANRHAKADYCGYYYW
jgi:hypothetical protein